LVSVVERVKGRYILRARRVERHALYQKRLFVPNMPKANMVLMKEKKHLGFSELTLFFNVV